MFGKSVRRSQSVFEKSPTVAYCFIPSPNNVHALEAQAELAKANVKPNYTAFSALKDSIQQKVDLNVIKSIEVHRTDQKLS